MTDESPRCAKCGHSPGFHGATFCVHESGMGAKRTCDCDGWRMQLDVRQREQLSEDR